MTSKQGAVLSEVAAAAATLVAAASAPPALPPRLRVHLISSRINRQYIFLLLELLLLVLLRFLLSNALAPSLKRWDFAL